MMIEELGGQSIGGKKIVVKNANPNISILRNRSTSPTIIPKKNLVKKGDNTTIIV